MLLSYSKMVVYQQIAGFGRARRPVPVQGTAALLPEPLQKKYADEMEKHRLKREIIATAVTNSTINRMGATFLLRMQEDTGRSPAEVAKAFTITREALDARALWAQIDALDGKVPEPVQIDALQVIWSLQRSFTRWLLSRPGAIPGHRHRGSALPRRLQRDPCGRRRAAAIRCAPPTRPACRTGRRRACPRRLPASWRRCRYLEPSSDIIELARARKLKPVEVSKVHYRLGEALHLPWLFEQIDGCRSTAAGMRWRAACCATNWPPSSACLPTRCCRCRAPTPTPRSATGSSATMLSLRFTLAMLNELAAQKTLDYPTASVAVQRLSQLSVKH